MWHLKVPLICVSRLKETSGKRSRTNNSGLFQDTLAAHMKSNRADTMRGPTQHLQRTLRNQGYTHTHTYESFHITHTHQHIRQTLSQTHTNTVILTCTPLHKLSRTHARTHAHARTHTPSKAQIHGDVVKLKRASLFLLGRTSHSSRPIRGTVQVT